MAVTVVAVALDEDWYFLDNLDGDFLDNMDWHMNLLDDGHGHWYVMVDMDGDVNGEVDGEWHRVVFHNGVAAVASATSHCHGNHGEEEDEC